MTKRPQDTSAEEPDGGNPHIRFRGGPRLGDRPGLLNNQSQSQSSVRIAFIQAGWHPDIIGKGRESFLAEMGRLDFPLDHADVFTVPGAFEIPLLAKRLAKSEQYRGIVACAFVVNGGIYRHDFVANAVIQGMMQVQLDTEIPVFSMVLTPHNFHEHEPHKSFFLDHFVEKGKEVALACVKTLAALDALPRRTVIGRREGRTGRTANQA